MRLPTASPDATGPVRDGAAALVDRHSPELLQLAGLFAGDPQVAQRMVVRAWEQLLRDGLDACAAAGPLALRAALVRGLGCPAADDDPHAAAAGRALRIAMRSAGSWVPQQLRPDRADEPAPRDLAEGLRALPGALRLVLLLTDVQRWPAAEVEDLLELRPAARRALLAHARDRLSGGTGRAPAAWSARPPHPAGPAGPAGHR